MCERFVPKEQIELHKAEFRVKRRKQDKKLPDLASSLRRLISKVYPKAAADLQDSLAKDQFINALGDREIRMKIHESGPKTFNRRSVEPRKSRQCTKLSFGVAEVGRSDLYRNHHRTRIANSQSFSSGIRLL